jgi:hypothetical protein
LYSAAAGAARAAKPKTVSRSKRAHPRTVPPGRVLQRRRPTCRHSIPPSMLRLPAEPAGRKVVLRVFSAPPHSRLIREISAPRGARHLGVVARA